MSIRCHTLNGLRIHSWKFINSVTYSHHRCISMCNRACSESDDDAERFNWFAKMFNFLFQFHFSCSGESNSRDLFYQRWARFRQKYSFTGHGYYHEASNELTYLPWLSAVQTLHCLSCKTNANQFIKNIVQWFN